MTTDCVLKLTIQKIKFLYILFITLLQVLQIELNKTTTFEINIHGLIIDPGISFNGGNVVVQNNNIVIVVYMLLFSSKHLLILCNF